MTKKLSKMTLAEIKAFAKASRTDDQGVYYSTHRNPEIEIAWERHYPAEFIVVKGKLCLDPRYGGPGGKWFQKWIRAKNKGKFPPVPLELDSILHFPKLKEVKRA